MQLTANGIVGLTPADPLSLHIHASVPDLATAVRRALPRKTVDVAGALESDALITGSYAKPQLPAGFDLTKPVVKMGGPSNLDGCAPFLIQYWMRSCSNLMALGFATGL